MKLFHNGDERNIIKRYNESEKEDLRFDRLIFIHNYTRETRHLILVDP